MVEGPNAAERARTLRYTLSVALISCILGAVLGATGSWIVTSHAARETASNASKLSDRQQRAQTYFSVVTAASDFDTSTSKALYDATPYSATVSGQFPNQTIGYDASFAPQNAVDDLVKSYDATSAYADAITRAASPMSIVSGGAPVTDTSALTTAAESVVSSIWQIVAAERTFPSLVTAQDIATISNLRLNSQKAQVNFRSVLDRFRKDAQADLES